MIEYERNPNIKCSTCKKDIYKRPSQIKRAGGKAYCSVACYGISCRKEIPCVVCGTLILGGMNKKTCSRGCANTHRAGIQYKINRPRDKVKSQQALKVRLLEARGRKCERCNYDKFEILQVHHMDKDRSNNDLSNLQLICPNCHCEEHYLEKSWLKKLENNTEI